MTFSPSRQTILRRRFSVKNKFFLATKNNHKVTEFRRVLEPLGIEVICERDLEKSLPEVEETGTTFLENAMLKAESGARHTGLITVADDSGICVDALGGAPGVYSARYSGENADDHKNNLLLLENMKKVPEEKRGAYFECAIACVFPDGRHFSVNGRCYGKVAYDIDGDKGFGYDRVFLTPIGRFSMVEGEKKDEISHRGEAIRKFVQEIQKYL